MQVRKHGLSRALNKPQPGACSFAPPVDYSGHIALGLGLLGRSVSFDFNWDGPQAQAAKRSAAENRVACDTSYPTHALVLEKLRIYTSQQ